MYGNGEAQSFRTIPHPGPPRALQLPAASKQALAKQHPLQRVGQPEDLAALADFLLREDASWITGQVRHAGDPPRSLAPESSSKISQTDSY